MELPHPLGGLERPAVVEEEKPLRLVIRFGDLEVTEGMQVPHTLIARPPFCSIDPQEHTPGRTFALFWEARTKAEAPLSILIWARVNLSLTRKGLIGGDTIAEYIRPTAELDRQEEFYLFEQPATPVNLEAMPNHPVFVGGGSPVELLSCSVDTPVKTVEHTHTKAYWVQQVVQESLGRKGILRPHRKRDPVAAQPLVSIVQEDEQKQEISMDQRAGFDPAVFAARHEMQLTCTLSFRSVIMTPERVGELATDQLAPMGTLHPDNIPTRGAPNYTPQWRSQPGRMLSQSIRPEPP